MRGHAHGPQIGDEAGRVVILVGEGYAANLAALKGIKASWERRDYVAKGNWANVGNDSNFAVADACAEALNNL